MKIKFGTLERKEILGFFMCNKKYKLYAMQCHLKKVRALGLDDCGQCIVINKRTGKQCRNKAQCHKYPGDKISLCHVHEPLRYSLASNCEPPFLKNDELVKPFPAKSKSKTWETILPFPRLEPLVKLQVPRLKVPAINKKVPENSVNEAEACPIPKVVKNDPITRNEMFLLANLRIIDSVVSKMTERILVTEKLMEMFCTEADLDKESDTLVQEFRKSETLVNEKLQKILKQYKDTQTISVDHVNDIQEYYYQDFLPLEYKLHEHLEKTCKSKGKFPLKVDAKFTFTKTLTCEQKKASAELKKWLAEPDETWVDKQLLCTFESSSPTVFFEGDLLPRGYIVVKVEGAFLGIARKKEKPASTAGAASGVATQLSNRQSWPQYLTNATFGALSGITSTMSTLLQYGTSAIGLTADLLTMAYRNVSFKMILCGIAVAAGTMSLSYITSMGLEPIVQLAYYSKILCQMVTNPAAAVTIALLITSKLVDTSNQCQFAIQFGRVFLTIYGFRNYCSFLTYLGSRLFTSTATALEDASVREMERVGNSFGLVPFESGQGSAQNSIPMLDSGSSSTMPFLLPAFVQQNVAADIDASTAMTLWVQQPTTFNQVVQYIKSVKISVNPWVSVAMFSAGLGMLAWQVVNGDVTNAAVTLVKLTTNGVIQDPQMIANAFPQLSAEVVRLGGLSNILTDGSVREASVKAGIAIYQYFNS